MKRLASPHLRCPVCQGNATPMLELSFSEKKWLPDKITLALCAPCDFAFSGPADADNYLRYYAANTNDLISISGGEPPPEEQRRYDVQTSFLHELLDKTASKRVLDIGCGQGGLLRTLLKRFTQHVYHGTDPNLDLENGLDGIAVCHDWRELPRQTFDLITMSHTLEHMVDLEEITAIRNLLAPGGFLYIEVPDASRYAEFPRREYLYYIDRLHINHFTPTSLERLLQAQGMALQWAGRHDFRYKDDRLYPAFCILATDSAADSAAVVPYTTPLVEGLPRYLQGEAEKAKTWRQDLTGSQQPTLSILVYGFGDNFFRAINPKGPLAGLHVQAIVDRRWQALRESRYSGAYHFIGLAEAAEKYAAIPIVITVSFGAEAIAQDLRNTGHQHVFIL